MPLPRSNRLTVSFVAVIAMCGVACASKPDAPAIQLTDVGFVLHLPPAMQHALDAAAPGFQQVRTTSFRSDVSQAAVAGGGGLPALSATVGDFDHDGTVDAAVEGTVPGDPALQVFVILNGATPKAMQVASFASYDADAVGIYLTGVSAGTAGAFEVVSYPDSSTVFQYQDGAFAGSKLGS
ncbi:MAG TPA: hypothetical protein VGM67_08265 [Gemmatimonadaceae bacterium]